MQQSNYKSDFEEQVIALSGVFQAASLVRQIAHDGFCNSTAYEASINSLFVTSPDTTLSVFGSLSSVNLGLRELLDAMNKNNDTRNVEIIRYALSLIHLESKLRRRSDLLSLISQRISKANDQVQHFGGLHPNVLSNLASIYTDTISTFSLRIQVVGQPEHLKVSENADKIRALLLSGIRSAMLWRQLGGKRWHLIFKRAAVAKQTQLLIKKI